MQITNLLIRSDNSAAAFDVRRLIAKDTVAPAAKEICHICQQCSQQILQNKGLSLLFNLFGLNMNDLEYPTNSRSILFLDNKTVISMRGGEHKGLISPMDRRILQNMDEQNSSGIPFNSNIFKNDFISQQRGEFSNRNCTMRAESIKKFKLSDTNKQVPYLWTVKLSDFPKKK
ncbi:MAG: hypothetical protein EZS28_052133 [Streblomastix strix]|uniref:Uncharacterized protein n=1 Tax=Streblomastix strix TaxID=222440 RepID=A0A5J4SJB6_9EUKA|nr:MAG: hypothetical protein EZS28_052133 [Streblomastix strix]